MAINTRIRLQQITGSIGTGDGQINDATTAVAAGSMNPADLSTVLSHLAAGLQRVHGASTFSEQTAGKFDSAQFDVNASGAATIDSADDSNLTVTGEGKNLDVAVAGGGDQHLRLSSAGTSADAIDISATAGGIDIDADGGKLTLDGSGGIDIGVESDVAVDFHATTFDLDASGAITVDGVTGNYNMSGRLGLSGSNVEIMAKNSSMVLTGAAGIQLKAESGVDIDADGGFLSLDGSAGINIGTESDVAIDVDATTFDLDASGAITVDGSTGNYNMSGRLGLSGSNVEIMAKNSSMVLTGAAGIQLKAESGIDVDADGGFLSLDGSAGINIGTESDVAIDVDSSTFDLDASGAVTIDGTGAGNIAMSSRLGLSGSSLEMMATGGNAVLTGSSFVGFSSHELPTLSSHFGASMLKVANSGEYTAFSNKAAFDGVDSIVGALNALANAGAPMRYDMSVGSSGLAGGQSLDISTSSSQGTVVKSSDSAEASSQLSANGLPHKVDVYYNGMLLVSGSSSAVSAGTADYRLSGTESLAFAFALTGSDRITVIDRS